jgi:cell wall assembly regulator SMI1
VTVAVAFRHREPPGSVEQIARLEARLGRVLPEDYRDYLLAQDGGRLADNSGALDTIFGLGDVPDWASLWDKLDVLTDRMPSWMLPVADDAYGNLYAISLRPDDFGSVWFWDHEEEADEGEPPSEENIAWQAASWSAFLEQLRPLS